MLLGGIFYFTNRPESNPKPESKEEKTEQEQNSMIKEDAMAEDEKSEMMEKNDNMMKYSGTVLAGELAPLLDFKKSDYDTALKSDKIIVVYFYANWCPICRAEFPIMQGVFNELTTDKVIGFRVNYNDEQTDDDERNLAREFGVAYQHTKVFVKNNQRILKSPESWDGNRYKTEINKYLTQ
ncbi:MAG: hypothetical protein COV30_02435 [Candidatus Yanofskybacteria bacterium CG10_big_fil_rev_8_21_14_0_10_37_15]|uniref:Thioredoxin domain-containing protein n=1 Tax=Candidatus Yanofskybacteria bacterium CG10_big_fil_rev_8_21_14_0_10_37_15 TaxID=1975097 RepID=A0A2H0R5R2_9BACT|nr:MAG: hypothetical protein COV30_02435 [Candidatus Yanofskybacteria bacterium CG10_big_fil_rev_8_21_14_0_10_37_15]